MTRPDPARRTGANQDDAVWLDLVARLRAAPARRHPQDDGNSGDADRSLRLRRRPVQRLRSPGTLRRPARRALRQGTAGPDDRSPQTARRAPARRAPQRRDAADGPDGPAGPAGLRGDDDLSRRVRPGGAAQPGRRGPADHAGLAGRRGRPVALLLSAMFWRSAPLMAILGIVAVFAASVVYLIMKLPREKDEHDDGARV